MSIQMSILELVSFLGLIAAIVAPILKEVLKEVLENQSEETSPQSKKPLRKPDMLEEFLRSLDPVEPRKKEAPPIPPPSPKAQQKKQTSHLATHNHLKNKNNKFAFKSTFDENKNTLKDHHLKSSFSNTPSIVSAHFQNENFYQDYEESSEASLSPIEEIIDDQEQFKDSIIFHAILAKPKALER